MKLINQILNINRVSKDNIIELSNLKNRWSNDKSRRLTQKINRDLRFIYEWIYKYERTNDKI